MRTQPTNIINGRGNPIARKGQKLSILQLLLAMHKEPAGVYMAPENLGQPINRPIELFAPIIPHPLRFRQRAGDPTLFDLLNNPFFMQRDADHISQVSHNPLAAGADATEFVAHMRGKDISDGFQVVEFGVGHGKYAFDFIKGVQSLSPEIAAKMTYYMVDNQYTYLESIARRIHGDFPCKVVLVYNEPFSAFPPILQGLSNVQLIRHNEFYSVLPATELVRRSPSRTWFEMNANLFFSQRRLTDNSTENLLMSMVSPATVTTEAFENNPDWAYWHDTFSHVAMQTCYSPFPDLASVPYGFVLETEDKAGSPIPFNFSAYDHFIQCLKLLRASGGYMRFNDIGTAPSLSTNCSNLANQRHLKSPLSWQHFRLLAQNRGFSFEHEPHGHFINRQLGTSLLAPTNLSSDSLIDFIIEQANRRDEDGGLIIGPATTEIARYAPKRITREVIADVLDGFRQQWWRENNWANPQELLWWMDRDARINFGYRRMQTAVEWRALKALYDLARRPFPWGEIPEPIGDDRVSDLEMDIRLVARRCGQDAESIEMKRFLRAAYAEEMDHFDREDAREADFRDQNKFRPGLRFLALMHSLFGDNWREAMLPQLLQAEAKTSPFITAVVK